MPLVPALRLSQYHSSHTWLKDLSDLKHIEYRPQQPASPLFKNRNATTRVGQSISTRTEIRCLGHMGLFDNGTGDIRYQWDVSLDMFQKCLFSRLKKFTVADG